MMLSSNLRYYQHSKIDGSYVAHVGKTRSSTSCPRSSLSIIGVYLFFMKGISNADGAFALREATTRAIMHVI